jgi:hypothetical protein
MAGMAMGNSRMNQGLVFFMSLRSIENRGPGIGYRAGIGYFDPKP